MKLAAPEPLGGEIFDDDDDATSPPPPPRMRLPIRIPYSALAGRADRTHAARAALDQFVTAAEALGRPDFVVWANWCRAASLTRLCSLR